jgi:hypothetical protein
MSSLHDRLNGLYKAVRSPTYSELQRLAALEGNRLPTSTISSLLKAKSAPRWDTVEAFVVACRKSVEARRPRIEISAEIFDLDAWRSWHDEAFNQTLNTDGSVTVAPMIDTTDPVDQSIAQAARRCIRQLIVLQYPWGEWSDRRTDLESEIAERNPRAYAAVPKPNAARTLFAIEALGVFPTEEAKTVCDNAIRWMLSNISEGWFREWTEGQTPHSETHLPEMVRRADVRHTAQTITALSSWQSERDPLASLARNVAGSALMSGFWPNNPSGNTPRLLATVYSVEALANLVYGVFRLPISDIFDRKDEAIVRGSLRRGISALLADCERGSGLIGSIAAAPNPYITGLALFRLGKLAGMHPDFAELAHCMVDGLQTDVRSYGWEDASLPMGLRPRTRNRTTLRCAAGLALAASSGVVVSPDLMHQCIQAVTSLVLSHDGLSLDSPDYACALISLLNTGDRPNLEAIWPQIDASSVRSEVGVLPMWRAELIRVVGHLRAMRDLGMPGYSEAASIFESRLNTLKAN